MSTSGTERQGAGMRCRNSAEWGSPNRKKSSRTGDQWRWQAREQGAERYGRACRGSTRFSRTR